MLSFFREHAEADGSPGAKQKLATILTEAQRSTHDAALKKELGAEIARLAESSDNALKAIEQYKSILKADPADADAHEALKRLYGQVANWPALVDVLRHELERLPADDKEKRVAVLSEIASIHRDRAKNEQQLVQVLQQIVQLDDTNAPALRELVRIYEALGRFRDLLTCQQRLAELTEDATERGELYRAVARRWAEQFSNVQNAIAGYEGLLAAMPQDEEARAKLRELYTKRRAWGQLYALYEIEAIDAEGADKIALLGEMAKLASERLDRGADAILLQKKILDLDPSAVGVYDALEKQAEREKDYATLAEVLERRAGVTADQAAKLAILQKLGAVYSDRLKDAAAATRTWRRVLELAPGQAKALRVLREAYVASGDFDALEELYSAQDDWESLADFLSSSADKATEAQPKIELSFRAAAVYEGKLGAPERSTRSYERVLAADPGNARAARALVPIYEKEERWVRLPALYEILLGVAESDDERVATLRRLASVTGGPLSDRAAALGYARRAYELAPTEQSLDALEAASRAASNWVPFVEAIEARLSAPLEDAAAERTLRKKLANAYARELGRLDEAVVSYRKLVEADPTDDETLREFDGLLRGAERKDDLRWLFELRVRTSAPGDRARTYEEWATLEEDVFGNPKEAIALYRKAAEIDDKRPETLRSLARLLLAENEHAAAAAVIERHRDLAEGDARAQREIELAFLYIDNLERPGDALDAAERALDLRPRDADAIGILARLVDAPTTRARAARTLQAAYAQLGDYRREAQMLRVMLETADDAAERLELLVALAEVEESKLSSPGAAFDVTLSALTEFAGEMSLWERAAELSAKAGRPTDLAEAYRAHIITSDPDNRAMSREVELELCDRAATLHDEQLGDADGALPYLKRILAMDATNEKAFERLKQILTSAERWGELEELFDQAAQGAEDPIQKIALLNEVALISEEVIGSPQKSISYHERILAIDPSYVSSLDALEKLYEDEERYGDLAALLERRLETAIDEEAVDIRLYLGRLYLEQLLVPDRALAHIEEILRSRHDDADARELAERMLDIGSLRLRTAALLENVYEARDEVRSLVRMLEIRLDALRASREGAKDAAPAKEGEADEKKTLLRRIGELKDERLHDDAGAFEALAQLIPLVPDDDGVRERFIEIGKRINKHERVQAVLSTAADNAESPRVRAEILMLVANLLESSLGDATRAEEVYRRVLTIDPHEVSIVAPAARALSRLQADAGRHAALAETLEIEVKLEESIDARKALFERLGDLYESMLENRAKAIDAWSLRLADDGSDEKALGALERLYEAQGTHRELVGVLKKREEVTTDPDERKRAMVKAAQVLAGPIGDVTEATQAWRAVLETFGADRAAHAALSGLYEKAERYQDLGEIIDADLALADEPADKIALYRRLGDVRRQHLSDLDGALEAYRQALAIEPSDPPTRAALEQMLELPDARRNAAEVLHPLYEADGDAEKLLKVLDIEAEVADSTAERVERLEKALATAEGPLGDPARAYAYAKRAFKEAAGDDSIAKQRETLERLTAATSRWEDTTQLYREVAPDVLDGDVQLEIYLRIGELARERLEKPDLAIEHYQKALESRPDERRAMVALEALYEQKGDAKALLDILRRREEAAESESERKQLILRQSELLRDKLEDSKQAIERLEAALEIAVDPRITGELEQLYTKEQRWQDLVDLYQRMLEQPGETSTASLRVKIARVAREKLQDSSRAFDELQDALANDPTHPEAIAELEVVLASEEKAQGEDRARAAEMLEPVYLKQGSWTKVQRTLEARLEVSNDPTERIELLKRLAQLQEEQLENFGAAMDATARLLHEDIGDRAVWAELERLSRASSSDRKLGEIYAAELSKVDNDDDTTAELSKRAGQIFASVGEVDKALSWFRRARAFEPESEELFASIEKLLVQEKRHAERVDLMRSMLDYRAGAGSVQLLHGIAGLEEGELERFEDAIETYRAALDVDPADARSLDRLTELYGKLGRHRDLADHYQRRIDGTPDPVEQAPFRLALARLLLTKLDDKSAAINELDTIVQEDSGNREALAELEALANDPEHKARVVDILQPIYMQLGAWTKQIELTKEQLNLATDKHDKAAILRKRARLYEDNGGDKAAAFQAVREAFDVDAEDSDTRAELERLARDLKSFGPLAETLEAAAARVDDEVTKRELLDVLGRVYDKDLDDPRSALATYERLAEVSPQEPEPLDRVDDLSVLLGDWRRVTGVIEKKAADTSDVQAAALFRRLGQIQAEMLEDRDSAIKAYERALELEPDLALTIDRLLPLYEEADASQRLVELYARRAELATSNEADLRYELSMKAAERQEKSLSNPREAIVSYNAALEARAGDAAAMKALERLYRSEGMFEELLDNLRDQAARAELASERAGLRVSIGDLYKDKLSQPVDALEQYRLVLEEVPGTEGALTALRSIAETNDDLRLEATDILLPVLRASGNHEDRVRALELRLKALTDSEPRATALKEIADVLDRELSRPQDAEAALLRAIEDAPEDDALHADIERLAEKSPEDGFKRYADALEGRASQALDASVGRHLFSRLGHVAEKRLSDDARAAKAFERALEQAAGDESEPRILADLDRIQERLGNHKALAEILERRIPLASESDQSDLYDRLARLQIHQFQEPQAGLGSLRAALERRPGHAGAREELEKLTAFAPLFEEVSETLESVYRQSADHRALAGLFEKRIAHASSPSDRLRLRLDLARVLEDQASDPKAALGALLVALDDDPGDSDVLAEVERVAAIVGGWEDAAAGLEKAIRAKSDLPGETASDLWNRAASWRKDKLSDLPGAERDYEEALKHDAQNEVILRAIEQIQRAPGREKDLVATLRRLAALDGIAGAAELRREAKSIAQSQLADAELAEAVLREMIAADEADAWALGELTELRRKAGDAKETFKLLVRRTELAASAEAVRELRHDAAAVARADLKDPAAAIDLYEQIFEDEPTDSRASSALRELYAETGKKKELLKLLGRLVDVADDAALRASLRLESAKVSDELEATTEAIEQLGAILEDNPAHREAALFLSRLYEKTGRDDDLAELLEKQIGIARDRGDLEGELSYRLRLGEVQEGRIGDLEKASATFTAVLERDAQKSGEATKSALVSLARIQDKRGDKKDAAKHTERLLELQSGDDAIATAKKLAAMFDALGDDDGTQRALERGLSVNEREEEIRAKLRTLYEKQKSYEKLADLLIGDARAAEETPEKVRLLRSAADIFRSKLGSSARASELLSEASELAPQDRELLLTLCDAYSESGKGKQAAAVLHKIVESYGGRRSKEVAGIHHPPGAGVPR
jgi:tetratricopeptide (TPR) repeat protein